MAIYRSLRMCCNVSAMGKIIRFWRWRGPRRLKGLEEFDRPEFVGRMERTERRRKLAWWVMLGGAVAVGAGLGMLLF